MLNHSCQLRCRPPTLPVLQVLDGSRPAKTCGTYEFIHVMDRLAIDIQGSADHAPGRQGLQGSRRKLAAQGPAVMGALLEALDRAGPARVVCSTCGFTRPPVTHLTSLSMPLAACLQALQPLLAAHTHYAQGLLITAERQRCCVASPGRWRRQHASSRSTQHTAAAASRDVAAWRNELPDKPIAKTNPVSGIAMSALQECGGAAPPKQKAGQGACPVERPQKVITAPGA